MPGINRLQTTILQLNGDVTSKSKLAESLQNSAQTHRDAGDDVKAQSEQDSADRYFQEAQDIESQIAGMQAMMSAKQIKKDHIDKQFDEITKNYEKEVVKLKNDADKLT